MPAIQLNETIVRGQPFRRAFQRLETNGQPTDLTNWQARFVMALGECEPAAIDETDTVGGSQPSAADGIVSLNLEGSTTATISLGEHAWYINLISPGGDPELFAEGVFTFVN